MRYWAGLYPEETQRMITTSVDLMVRTALRLLKRQHESSTLMITEAGEDEDGHAGARAEDSMED
jgi:hypothetical protein